MRLQITSKIMMIQPVHFGYNEETGVDNHYMKPHEDSHEGWAQQQALKEFKDFVDKLRAHDIDVIVFEDTYDTYSPDSIFPNNWVSFHQDGRVALYPMYAENRRTERRDDILEKLSTDYHLKITEIKDFSHYEDKGGFLEGTGAMVLDRKNKQAYISISTRAHLHVFEDFCQVFGYKTMIFRAYHTVDGQRLPIYHTNVLMGIGENIAVICADAIDDSRERDQVLNAIAESGREVILISEEQKHSFAGNILQLASGSGQIYTVMSSQAYASLDIDQIERIEHRSKIIHSPLDTIEKLGGGSARCMIAEIFLPKAD
ncbi:MAG: arginine deiminase-related protein [Bacteroidota bacterium]